MKKLKPLDYRILRELMKGAKRSDREIAEVLGVSQPTVTRRRVTLERELIDSYTVIPKWRKLGYKILAFTFVKTKPILGSEDRFAAAQEMGTKWLMENPNIIMGGGCRGMGMNAFFISVHKGYSDFNQFMLKLHRKMGDMIDDSQTFMVELGGSELLKPLHLKYLAETKQEERS